MRSALIKIFLGVAALLTSFTLTAGANVFDKNGKDPLVKQSQTGVNKAFAAIGRVVTNQPIPWNKNPTGVAQNFESTGFLVSPCLIMTSYHSVFGNSRNPNAKDFSVTFHANRSVKATPIAWGPRESSGLPADDWTLLSVEANNCLGKEVGWLQFPKVSIHDLPAKKLMTAGYPGRKTDDKNPDQLWIHRGCSAYPSGNIPQAAGTILNDCALSPGQSGSPIFYEGEGGQLFYFGIQTGSFNPTSKILTQYDSKYANIAVNLTSIDDSALMAIGADLRKK